MSFFIPAAAAAEGDGGTGTGGFEFILLIGFVAIFYFLIWRPQSKRQKEHRELVSSLSKGDEIVTNGGIMGQITQVRAPHCRDVNVNVLRSVIRRDEAETPVGLKNFTVPVGMWA